MAHEVLGHYVVCNVTKFQTVEVIVNFLLAKNHYKNILIRTISSHLVESCTSALRVGQLLTLKVLVATIDAQWEGMGDVGSARYEPTLLPSCPTVMVLSYSN